MLAVPLFVLWQWVYGLQPLLLGVQLVLMMGISVVHHNHAHLPMWNGKWFNTMTDLYLSVLQGHPTYVFHATHNENHHRYHHGPQDAARTYRFGGDTNHLLGYCLHPFQAVWVLYPLFFQWLLEQWRARAQRWRFLALTVLQYGVVLALWCALLFMDAQRFLILVFLPQLFALHWLLGANYLQHAHADGNSNINFARNFDGWVNILFFNIGYHTAHHLHPQIHWSDLPLVHKSIAHRINPRLNQTGLLCYMWNTFVRSLLQTKWRSCSLMTSYKANSLS